MSTVVGLDLSLTSAGVVVLVDGRPKVIHSVRNVKDGNSYAHRSRRVRSQCRAVMAVIEQWAERSGEDYPELAVIEGPSYGSEYGDQFDRAGLWHGVFAALDASHVPIAVIAPSTLKLWFTGNGGNTTTKLRMLNTARGRFREPISTHDEADAIAAAMAGAHHLGDPIPFEPNKRQIDALAKVEWPETVKA